MPANSIFSRKIGKNFYVRLTMGNAFNKNMVQDKLSLFLAAICVTAYKTSC